MDINTAEENELVKNLRITHRLAKRIIALRPFQSLDQLNSVWGIEPVLLTRIQPLFTINNQGNEFVEQEKIETFRPNVIVSSKDVERKYLDSQQASRKVVDPAFLKEDDSSSNRINSEHFIKTEKSSWKINLAIVVILLVGAYFRFTGLNWDQNQHQHPDERFITMVVDQIRGVDGISDYFNTQESTLNPLKIGSYTYGMFPLFFSRMIAEWLGMTSYNNITLVGRALSGLFDLAAVFMLFLLGKRLYSKRIGLLAAALGTATVLSIQLSHYFTVDSFSTVFIILVFYFGIQAIPLHFPEEKLTRSNYIYFTIFGFLVGLAGACKVNTLPVFGIIILAGFARLITNWKKPDIRNQLMIILTGWALSILFAFLAFRVFQPYAFTGPGFLGINFNQNWIDVIKEVTNFVAGNSDWPPNTHWTNRSIFYALTNMVSWGLGLPLGLAGWFGWFWAGAKIWRGDWRRHLLPFFWVLAYFIWQNFQFWRYMRYFLPIYPFIILFAAWALNEIFDRTSEIRAGFLAKGPHINQILSTWRQTWKGMVSIIAIGFVLIGTFAYAFAFTRIYTKPITRIVASEWILSNIPGPLNLIVETPSGNQSYPVAVGNKHVVEPGDTSSAKITIVQSGTTSNITSTNVQQIGVSFHFLLASDKEGSEIITEGSLAVNDDDLNKQFEISFGDIDLNQNETYFFLFKLYNSSKFSMSDISLRNVDNSDSSLLMDLSLSSQDQGMKEGLIEVHPESMLTINQLKIGNFNQKFFPGNTTLKVSIYSDDEDNNSLLEATQTLNFSHAGERLSPTFNFSPVSVIGNQTYQVRYEIISGVPIRLSGEVLTLETSWDDALPLNINNYDAQGGIYEPLNLELYEPDTPEKRDSMIKILSESNFIVIPSNRAYDAMPRMPLRYPLTLKYYQTLFDCNCSGDALEQRAAELKPPFKSPLGFDLVATFENPPSLGTLVFPDQSADESFTVYDHPKVMVFKKSVDFSIDLVSTILNDVNLDQVIFQTTKQYSQVPTAMQLPSDRLIAQTNGGTWSSMFNRAGLLNSNEFLGGVVWYLLLFLLGLIVLPFIFLIFSSLPDRGYPLIRIAGLILVTWLVWFLGSLKILPFEQLTIWLCIGLILILCVILVYRQKKVLSEYLRFHWKQILVTEAIFMMIFLFSLWVRVGNPDLWNPWLGGEKPMDFAFFNAILKSVYFPPENPWFSGHYLNYYYYGYVIAAIPTKLLGILPSSAYNLILPSWFAMTGVGIFSVSYNLVSGLHINQNQIRQNPENTDPLLNPILLKQKSWNNYLPYLAGIIAMTVILFLGNLEEVRILWKYLPEVAISDSTTDTLINHTGEFVGGAIQILDGESNLPGGGGRWYFDASRPILQNGPDTPIAEFPYFTFLFGDMHPHMLTMPIYALALTWMLSLVLLPFSSKNWRYKIITLVAAGLIFGSFRASHTWDFPTFLGLGALVILWDVWKTRNSSIQQLIQKIIGYELAFVGISIALYLPFSQWFKTEYASLQFWVGLRTPLSDYFTVFGLAIFVMLSLLIQDLLPILKKGFQKLVSTSNHKYFSNRHITFYFIFSVGISILFFLWIADYQVLTFGLPILGGIVYLILFKRDLSILRKITWILFGIGLSITLFVEVFVLKGDIGRTNTVFRFYNQVWFIFGLAESVALIELISNFPHWPRKITLVWILTLVILILFSASYPLIATQQKISDRWPGIHPPPPTLDGAAFMLGDTSNLDNIQPTIYDDDNRPLNLTRDYAAIVYMQENTIGSPVIVEGHTQEYRWGSRFSIYTGLPSVVGWSWHVRQHNSLLDGAVVDKRIEDVENFYNTSEIQTANDFLNYYQVKYIIVGDLERAYYTSEGIEKFTNMENLGILRVTFGDNTSKTTTIYEVVKVTK